MRPPPPPAKGQSAARVQESLKTSSHVPAARIRRHHSDAQHTLFFSQRATASAWLALLRSLSLPSAFSLLSRSFKMPRCALAASISLFLSLPLPSPPLPLSSLIPHPSLCILPLFWLLCASWSLSFVSKKNQKQGRCTPPDLCATISCLKPSLFEGFVFPHNCTEAAHISS